MPLLLTPLGSALLRHFGNPVPFLVAKPALLLTPLGSALLRLSDLFSIYVHIEFTLTDPFGVSSIKTLFDWLVIVYSEKLNIWRSDNNKFIMIFVK